MEAVRQSGSPTPQFTTIKNDILMTVQLLQSAGRRVLEKALWSDIAVDGHTRGDERCHGCRNQTSEGHEELET